MTSTAQCSQNSFCNVANCIACAVGSSTDCAFCIDGYSLSNGACVTTCPSGNYSSSGLCLPCTDNCQECSTTGCEHCYTGFFEYDGSCYSTCPNGTIELDSEC